MVSLAPKTREPRINLYNFESPIIPVSPNAVLPPCRGTQATIVAFDNGSGSA
jgi:hypothetical protein